MVLLDEQNRSALVGAHAQVNGSVMIADTELRIVAQPNMEITKEMVEAMPPGQKMLITGIVYIHADVPPALLAEKFADLRLVGVNMATGAAQGALFGKLEMAGVTITLTGTTTSVVRNIGEATLDMDYLSRWEDDSECVNVGVTTIPAGIPEELVARKIKVYHNVGETRAPQAILALLKSRSATSVGEMVAV